MFWSEYKKKIRVLEGDIERLQKRMEEMGKDKIEIEKRQDQIDRIIKYSIHGQITCHRDDYVDKK